MAQPAMTRMPVSVAPVAADDAASFAMANRGVVGCSDGVRSIGGALQEQTCRFDLDGCVHEIVLEGPE
jgi:hypothetical protein